jgi:hypothetical protein
MLRALKICALAALAMAAPYSALADDGQTYATLHAGEPALEAGKARIYFYRQSSLNGARRFPSHKGPLQIGVSLSGEACSRSRHSESHRSR